MARFQQKYPLYYDATNEKGLSVAGLLFDGNAYYSKKEEQGKEHISPFEFIPWILGQCGDVKEAKLNISKLVREIDKCIALLND